MIPQLLSNWLESCKARRATNDAARGYTLSRKQIFFAYLIEVGIIGSGAFAGYEFANRYARPTDGTTQVASLEWLVGDGFLQPFANQAWWMAIIGTLAVCFAELARVPLAQATRTQRNWGLKLLAVIGLLFMCVVTTKTMSQVLEQVFNPRLHFVREANADLKLERNRLFEIETKKGSSNDELTPLEKDLRDAEKARDAADAQVKENRAAGAAIKVPEPRIEKYTYQTTCYGKRNKKGVRKSWKCDKTGERTLIDPWMGQQFADRDKELQAKLDSAIKKVEDARTKRDAALSKTTEVAGDISKQQSVITMAENKLGKAVADSQLHSFTAMVFGKDPRDVTDGEVHWFLRFFIFVPAIMIACASSLLAITAYRTIKPPKDPASGTLVAPDLGLDVTLLPSLAAYIATKVKDNLPTTQPNVVPLNANVKAQ